MNSDQENVARDQPLDRLLLVLNIVARAAKPISMTDIAAECGLPVPTMHRLVAQLETRGLLKRVLGSKKLVVGFDLVSLATSALEAALRADMPHQILVALANRIGEHCQLGLREDDAVVYVDTVQANRSQGLHFEHGRRSPLYCTSIGKLFLADMDQERFEWWMAHTELRILGPNTIVSPTQLQSVIKTVRKQGWAASNEEVAAGVVGCAVPVRDRQGRMVAGLGISVPSARVSYEQLPQFRADMEAAAAEITASLAQQE